ncbi:MAG: DUF2786 domain-containing protein, partial [Desulfobulbaceae bacterium]|nr:DUF2786 domain-containing protein [Desulfobulbaceae bacterium]
MDRNKAEFIHIWVRQLLREHKLICRRYGLKLTRPVIEVVDVSSYWGKWLAETTTISLSQTLLYSQTWDAVLNVLKHEMGHQLVAEVLDGAPGHGADFKRACEILGVPAQFRRASSTIAGAVPGEPDHRPTEAERILKKIRKLLALSDSTNEHEALLAMQKARQLLDIYNLDEELNQSKSEYTYTNLLINLRRKRVECYHRAICSLLIEYFHAEIVITPLYDAHDLTTYKCIDIMGKNSNVKIAGYVYHFLMDRLPALWRQHQTAKLRPKNGRNSYWLGVLNGFREGLANDLQAEEKATETANLPPATTANLPPATTANLPPATTANL